MNNRIEAAYEQRPRRWVFELAVALVVVVLLVWSGSAVETAGTTQNGAGDRLGTSWRASFIRTQTCCSISPPRAYPICCWKPSVSRSWVPL